MSLWTGLFLAALVTQRLVELAIARRNTARLLASGAGEVGAGHYPVMVAMHAAWVAAILVLGWDEPLRWGWLAVWLALQAARVWILSALGARWTTRIIVTDRPLVAKGPFRLVRHPNYLLVTVEIAVAPLVLGLWPVAAVFTVLNVLMLRHRIAVEDGALRPEAA